MPTSATSSQDTILQVDISAVFTPVPGIVGFSGPATSWVMDDITNLDSDFVERKTIIKDIPAFSFDMIVDSNFANAAQNYLRTANIAGTLETFKVIYPNAGAYTVTFDAFVSKYEVKAEQGKAIRATVELQGSGTLVDTP